MPLSDIVNVTISAGTAGIAQAGFGVPLIVAASPTWSERVRFYSGISGVAADFEIDDPAYLAALRIFSQNPKPRQIAIGRLAHKPTQIFTVSVVQLVEGVNYSLRVGASTCSATGDGSITNDEIIDSLKTAIDALNLDVTVTTPGASTAHTLVITGDNAGDWFDLEVLDTRYLAMAQTTADAGSTNGIADDLTAINAEESGWYCLIHPWNSQAVIEAAAEWIEAQESKIYIAQTQDSLCITEADATADDVMAELKDSAYARTSVWYHPATGAFLDAGLAGRCLPLTPGSETWMFKTVAGVPAVTLTGTHRTNLKAKYGNWYETIAGVNISQQGKVSANEYIDVIRFRDWLRARMGEAVYGVLANAQKVPFTDPGIALVENAIQGVLKQGVKAGGLAADPAPTTSVPLAADVSSNERAARLLPGVEFVARLAGAVHSLEIAGSVTA